MEPAIVPLCLYRKSEYDSYISLPVKSFKNGKTIFECSALENMIPITIFYGINPDMRPIPPGAVLMCIKNIPEEYVTIDIQPIYDPFDIDEKCSRMMVWLDPVPHTTPLYISKNGDSMHISLTKEIPKEYTELNYSPIYVLLDPRIDAQRTKGFRGQTIKDFKIYDDKPVFLFSEYQGKCIPDPEGIPLGNCVVNNILNSDGNEPSLIDFLNKQYKDKIDTKTIFLFCILIILIIITIYLIYQRNRKTK